MEKVLAKRKKGKPTLSGDLSLDGALWELAEALQAIVGTSTPTGDNQVQGSIPDSEEVTTDDQSSEWL